MIKLKWIRLLHRWSRIIKKQLKLASWRRARAPKKNKNDPAPPALELDLTFLAAGPVNGAGFQSPTLHPGVGPPKHLDPASRPIEPDQYNPQSRPFQQWGRLTHTRPRSPSNLSGKLNIELLSVSLLYPYTCCAVLIIVLGVYMTGSVVVMCWQCRWA